MCAKKEIAHAPGCIFMAVRRSINSQAVVVSRAPKGPARRSADPSADDRSSEARHRSQRSYRQVFVTFPIGRPRGLQAATPVRPDLVVVLDKGRHNPLILLQGGDRRKTRFPAHSAMPALYSRRGVSPAPLSEPDVRLSAHRALQ